MSSRPSRLERCQRTIDEATGVTDALCRFVRSCTRLTYALAALVVAAGVLVAVLLSAL